MECKALRADWILCYIKTYFFYLFYFNFQTFDDKKYLEAAKGCAEVVWARGLLRKGYGICHGVSGNAYTFLTVYRLTGEEKYLHRACKVSVAGQ